MVRPFGRATVSAPFETTSASNVKSLERSTPNTCSGGTEPSLPWHSTAVTKAGAESCNKIKIDAPEISDRTYGNSK